MFAPPVAKTTAGEAASPAGQRAPQSPARSGQPVMDASRKVADGGRERESAAPDRTSAAAAGGMPRGFTGIPIHSPDQARGSNPDSAAKGAKTWRATSDLWYLSGARGSPETPTKVTLATDADRGGDLEWQVSEGADKARLVGADPVSGRVRRVNENRVELESLAPSLGHDDVVVEATRLGRDGTAFETRSGRLGVRSPAGTRQVNVQTERSSRAAASPGPPDPAIASTATQPQPEQQQPEQQQAAQNQEEAPTAAPHHLNAKGISHSADATYAYMSLITYEVIDDRGTPINGFSVNEQWPGSVVKDDPTCTWRRGPPGGYPSTSTMFADRIGGEASGYVPTPTAPGTPLGSHATEHWSQDWYIGSTTPGTGTKVQSDTIQKYVDHAVHTNVRSPP